MVNVHPIEVESYRILADRIDLSDRRPLERAIVERMIHATADLSFADSVRVGDKADGALIDAIGGASPVVVDAAMVSAGITRYPTTCYLPKVPIAPPGLTRSAAAIRVAVAEYPEGAVFVFGNAPTALFELLELYRRGDVAPAAVVGLPVGFVGAAESKAALLESELAPISVTNVGERGGSAVAAGALNAVVRAVRAEASEP